MHTKQHDRNRDGISIEDRWRARGQRIGKRWLAKVRDTRLQRYKRKAFVDLNAAKDWSRVMRARLELAETSAGTWPLAEVITECVRKIRHWLYSKSPCIPTCASSSPQDKASMARSSPSSTSALVASSQSQSAGVKWPKRSTRPCRPTRAQHHESNSVHLAAMHRVVI